MNYGNYAPFYRPNYYPVQNASDGVNQFTQQYQQQMQAPVNQPTFAQQTSPIIWVSGEAGAKSYLVAPGNTVMLMDAENSTFYIKSADASGMPMPLRVFDYKERCEMPQQPPRAAVSDQNLNLDNFITREEFEQRIATVTSHCQCKNTTPNITEDVNNDEPLI